MLVLVDLTKLYFAVRDLRLHIDYGSLIEFIKDEYQDLNEEDIKFEAFTLYDPKNVGQIKFLENLESLGVAINKHKFGKKLNFSIDIAAKACANGHKHILVISNDQELTRLFSILKALKKEPALCFFSERLGGPWNPEILNGDVEFIDLSHPEVKNTIAGDRGEEVAY